jgi:hypothetical protein
MRGRYPTGLKVTDKQLAAVPLTKHDFHGDSNNTVHARTAQVVPTWTLRPRCEQRRGALTFAFAASPLGAAEVAEPHRGSIAASTTLRLTSALSRGRS